ncbi:MAG: alanine dehydrogenase, partial [Lutimonas sp.]
SGGFEQALRYDKGLQKGMYLYHGVLTNRSISDWFSLPFTDINLLIF